MPRLADPARRAHAEQRQAQILDAAALVFARKGYNQATVADVAREAGLATGSIYNYFDSKSDLLISLLRHRMRPAVESLGDRAGLPVGQGSLDPETTLVLIARTLLVTAQSNAPIFRILLSALPALKPAARQKYLDQVVGYGTGLLEAFFREQIEHGLIRSKSEPRVLARAFVGMFFPFIMLHDVLELEKDEPLLPDELAAILVPVFMNGARVPASRDGEGDHEHATVADPP